MTIFPLEGVGAADREASSCNAWQLLHCLVFLYFSVISVVRRRGKTALFETVWGGKNGTVLQDMGAMQGGPGGPTRKFDSVSSVYAPEVNPLKPKFSNYYTLPYTPNLPFLISDIRALWCSALSTRVHECRKLKTVG